ARAKQAERRAVLRGTVDGNAAAAAVQSARTGASALRVTADVEAVEDSVGEIASCGASIVVADTAEDLVQELHTDQSARREVSALRAEADVVMVARSGASGEMAVDDSVGGIASCEASIVVAATADQSARREVSAEADVVMVARSGASGEMGAASGVSTLVEGIYGILPDDVLVSQAEQTESGGEQVVQPARRRERLRAARSRARRCRNMLLRHRNQLPFR
ncbi:hypothetical protein JKP88DRAFT_41331, partial [Tribonema minus]